MARRVFSMEPIESMGDLQEAIQRYGFLPMFRSSVPGFSVYENTPQFWSDDEDGPWEWKGPIIREGNCAYGKFFNRKAGYVSMEWLPHFLNYRRTRHLAPNEESADMDMLVLDTIAAEGRATVKDLRLWLGLTRGRRKAGDLVDETEITGKVNLDTNLTRLMMEGRVCIADIDYNTDRRGNPYGWGNAVYTTPAAMYHGDIVATCSPAESYAKMNGHLLRILPSAFHAQIKKIID